MPLARRWQRVLTRWPGGGTGAVPTVASPRVDVRSCRGLLEVRQRPRFRRDSGADADELMHEVRLSDAVPLQRRNPEGCQNSIRVDISPVFGRLLRPTSVELPH